MNTVDFLIQDGWLKTPRIIESFRKIKRVDFIPDDTKNLAEINEALPIGYGQTISQPLTVAFMLEQLQPEPSQKILDIGSGSGWTTALLAYIVSGREIGGGGRVMAIEIIPELKEFGENNVAKYNFIEKGIAEFICADGSKGYKKEAPFDRILCSAAAEEIPSAWKEQLKIGGRIVTSVKNSIWTVIKISKKDFEEAEYPGFVFVPLVKK
ncbi:MAG: protein-L-isoaspartate O-methyltransferase [Candidatus Nealsonbacteria bacterium]|nr:protein-L-isoaspartate O-methyltransferase [Candidatus Nealsonbacteria bacterium]